MQHNDPNTWPKNFEIVHFNSGLHTHKCCVPQGPRGLGWMEQYIGMCMMLYYSIVLFYLFIYSISACCTLYRVPSVVAIG